MHDWALEDPVDFLNQFKDGAILDEIQRAPQLFSYLQEIVDQKSQYGRFIITGSQQFGLINQITQSLAGRIAIIELLPFTLDELYSNKFPTLQQVLFTGLYPPIHDRKLDPSVWFGNYVTTYIERDVRNLINIKDLRSFRHFVRLCAGRSGQLLNLSQLASDAGITHNTAKAWISILEASYLIFLLQPYYNNFNKRIIKTPKLYFWDTGLASHLLALESPEQIATHPLKGHLFENLIISELFKNRFNRGLKSNLYFWRDRSGNEIDIIAESGNSLTVAEIKSGQTINSSFFKGLDYWKNITEANSTCYLIYGGTTNMTRHGFQIKSWNKVHELVL